METQELFEKFEVEREPRWPIMLRLAGGSVVLHIALLACALYVPAVRDALKIAQTLSGTGFVDKAYRKTNIEDRAQILNLPKFQYPEGYFYKGDPMLPPPDPNAPQIMAQAPPVMVPPAFMPRPRRVKMPPGIPPATASASPSPSPSVDPKDPAQLAAANKGKTPDQLEAEMDKMAADSNIARPNESEINTRPLKDWLANANKLKQAGKLDLSKTVEVVIMAELDIDGKLVNPVVVQKSGDDVLIEVAKDMVAKLNDSNALSFLKKFNQTGLSGKQVRFTLKLDESNITAKVESEVESPERAQQIASGFNGLLVVGQYAKRGKDEEQIYKNTKVSSTGNQVIVNFIMPRHDAGELVKRQLPPAT